MSYVKREDRRQDILEAVVKVASADGFPAATIRRIASELDMAVGGIHHIFSSSAEMKREAFANFAHDSLERMDVASRGTIIDRLIPYLCPPDNPKEVARVLLWREAMHEATRDKAFAKIYVEAITKWRGQIVAILREGVGDKIGNGEIEALAWRLMAMSSGFSGFSRVSGIATKASVTVAHFRHMLALELAGLKRGATAKP